MTNRELTIRPHKNEHVFGCLPWVTVLPKESGLRDYYHCIGKTTKGHQCRNNPVYQYLSLQDGQRNVCQAHLHTILETDAEQERLEAWKKDVSYYELGNEQIVEEAS